VVKATSFRISETANTIIDNYMKTNKLTNRNLAVNQIIESFAVQTEQALSTDYEVWREIGCPAMLIHPDGFYVCANKAPKIVKVPFQQVCIFCWERQQKLKAQRIPQSPPIPNIYKKPEKIYCIGDTLYIDPLKHQAKCQRCKTKTLKVWAECQQKQRLP